MFHVVDDHNTYLRGVICQIMDEGLSDDLFNMLCAELKFALLDNPYFYGASIHLERNGKYYLLLFTSHDESITYFPDGCGCHLSFDDFLERQTFPVYCYIGEDYKIRPSEDFKVSDGIIICIDDREFIIEGNLLARLRKYFKTNLYSAGELKEMYDNMDNSRLEELLKDDPLDWDRIIRQIGNSTMLFSIDLDDTDDYDEVDRMFNFIRLEPFGYGSDITVSTSKGNEGYETVVCFRAVVDHAFKFGLKGLTIKTPDGEVFMSRNLLIEKYELIKKHCSDKRLKKSYETIFEIGVKE